MSTRQQQDQRVAEWAVAKASESLGNEEAEALIQDEIASLVSFVTEVIINREHDISYLSWRDSLIEQRNLYGRNAEGRRIEKPNMGNLTSTMAPAYFVRVIAKLAKVDNIEHVLADDEHLIEFRRLEIADGPMSATAAVYPDGSILMTQHWCGPDDMEIGSLKRTVIPSGEINHDVSQIKAVLNKALDGCMAAYIQKKYPTFWEALDRITTDLDVPFVGGLHRRHPLQLQWVMTENPGYCVTIDIAIDAVHVSNSWDDEVMILKWPAWLFAGRENNSYNPPSYEDLMHLIMLPIHRMIHESAGSLWEVGELENTYRILNYSKIAVDLCTGGDALLIEESVDYDTLLIILPSMDPTYETRKAAAKEQS